MTLDEAALFVATRWQMGHHPKAIMVGLVMLGFSVKEADVMRAVRAYVDAMSENKRPFPGKIPNP